MANNTFRLGRFLVNDRVVIGRLEGDSIHLVSEIDELPRALASEDSSSTSIRRIPVSEATLLAPLDPVARVFAVAVNYPAHSTEVKYAAPSRPLIFYKAPSNFVAPGGTLNSNKALTSQFDYEGELAVVIGRTCKDATVENALDFVVGVCALNDGSARDITKLALGKPGPGSTYWPDWTAGKSLDGSSGIGPSITCGPGALQALKERTFRVSTRLNGETVQDESIGEMVFSTEEIIATLSSYMTLLPGDVIATGTPGGVGSARNRFLQTGDSLEVEVSGLDILCMKVG